MGSAGIGADLLEDEDVSSVLLEPDRVSLNVAQDSVEVVLVDAQELTAVLPCDDCCSPSRRFQKNKREQCAEEDKLQKASKNGRDGLLRRPSHSSGIFSSSRLLLLLQPFHPPPPPFFFIPPVPPLFFTPMSHSR